MNQFEEHRDEFCGINGEALFAGTILHSLDHTLMEWNLTDPLMLDVEHPKFGLMAELGRFVRVGFVRDLPGLLINKSFKTAPGSFYQRVYAHAASINRKLADKMDTC